MSATTPVGARDLLKHGPFLFFLLSRSLSRFASQIAAVAIGWQIYDITRNPLHLGYVGLAQFVPPLLLVLDEGFGVLSGQMTTVHCYTGSQPTVDKPRGDPARSRAASSPRRTCARPATRWTPS